jgi:hypothetical protein
MGGRARGVLSRFARRCGLVVAGAGSSPAHPMGGIRVSVVSGPFGEPRARAEAAALSPARRAARCQRGSVNGPRGGSETSGWARSGTYRRPSTLGRVTTRSIAPVRWVDDHPNGESPAGLPVWSALRRVATRAHGRRWTARESRERDGLGSPPAAGPVAVSRPPAPPACARPPRGRPASGSAARACRGCSRRTCGPSAP